MRCRNEKKDFHKTIWPTDREELMASSHKSKIISVSMKLYWIGQLNRFSFEFVECWLLSINIVTTRVLKNINNRNSHKVTQNDEWKLEQSRFFGVSIIIEIHLFDVLILIAVEIDSVNTELVFEFLFVECVFIGSKNKKRNQLTFR